MNYSNRYRTCTYMYIVPKQKGLAINRPQYKRVKNGKKIYDFVKIIEKENCEKNCV